MPFAKKALTTSGGSPEARSASSTRSRQTRATSARIVGVVAAAQHLQHQHQPLAVGHQLAVRLAHRVQRLLARLAARGALEAS